LLICGIDPGLQRTGYGVISTTQGAVSIVDAGVIRTDRSDPLPQRLQQIHNGLVGLLQEYKIDRVAVEELYSNYRHPKTAILMGHARGVILLAALESDVPVEHFAATQIKKALAGVGRASKHQVQRSVAARLQLPEIRAPNDVSDALAVAICCWEHSRSVNYQ